MCPLVQWTMNVTTNTTIGVSPYEALFGVAPLIPHVFLNHDQTVIMEEFADKRLESYKRVFELVTEKLKIWNEKITDQRDATQRWVPNKEDLVLCIGPESKSLNVRVPLFNGPYKVLAVNGSTVYVQRDKDTIAVSQKDIKPYHSPYELNALQDERWKISRINFRDYSSILKHGSPSLSITWETGQTTLQLEDKSLDPVITEMEQALHKSIGINKSNAHEVYTHQSLVLGLKIPVLVNTGNQVSKVGFKRKKSLDPTKVLFQFVVKEKDVIGLVDDFDIQENNWRVAWQDGQITWVPYSFPADNLYGSPGLCYNFDCERASKRHWVKQLLQHDDYPPLHYYLRDNNISQLKGVLIKVAGYLRKTFQRPT